MARMRLPAIVFLTTFALLVFRCYGEEWWHTYTPVVSGSNQIKDFATTAAGAARGVAYHSGWYGYWFLDDQRRMGNAERRWNSVLKADMKAVMYYDAGEVGDYVAFFGDDGRLLYNGWSLPWWKGEPVTARWFGLQAFMTNVQWAPWRTAEDYNLPPFTTPDGKRVGNVYDVLARRDIDGNWKFDYFSNAAITDEIAEKTGLAEISDRQKSAPDVSGKSGWKTVRLVHVDYSNPQLRDYRCRELEWLIPQIKPHGIHIDNFGDFNILYPRTCAFGVWSLHRFKLWMKRHFKRSELASMGIEDIEKFDIREYILNKPFETRGKRGVHLLNRKWTEDKIWMCYLLSKVDSGLDYHRALYRSAKEAAKRAGIDCMVGGNVIPAFPGRALLKGACDIATFEWKTVGRFGPLGEMGLPPQARVGYVTRLGEAISDAPFCWAGIYVAKNLSGKGHEALHKILAFDCLANRGILDFGHRFLSGYSPGTAESALFINRFIRAVAPPISQRGYLADVGLVYCPWSGIASITVARFIPEMFFDEYAGWAKFLTKTHRQWDVLLTTDISYEKLSRFRVVLLPSVMVLTEKQVRELKRYVQSGGFLIATGRTGTRFGRDGYLMPRQRNALQPLLGHPRVRVTTDRPGCAYWQDEESQSAAKRMNDLIAFRGFNPRLRTNLPESVGVNLNIHRNGKGVLLTIDLNNYNLDVESDTITPAPAGQVIIRAPKALIGTKLRLSYSFPEMADLTAPVQMGEDSFRWEPKKRMLTIKTPSFQTYLIIWVEAATKASSARRGTNDVDSRAGRHRILAAKEFGNSCQTEAPAGSNSSPSLQGYMRIAQRSEQCGESANDRNKPNNHASFLGRTNGNRGHGAISQIARFEGLRG